MKTPGLFRRPAALVLKAGPAEARRSKKSEEEERAHSKDRTKDFATINLRPTESAKQTDQQQRGADGEKQKIRPRKITRDRKLRKELVTKQPADSDDEAEPDRPVPFPLHVDPFDSLRSLRTGLADAIPRIQR